MNNLKVTSHVNRMAKRDVPTGFLAGEYEEFSTEPVSVNGRSMKKSVVKRVSPVEVMSQYKVEDFYLENVLAAGATDMLKPMKYGTSRMDAIDSVDDAIFKFNDVETMNSAINNNVEKTNE